MSERILNLMDIRELILHIRTRASGRQVQRDTGFDRRTVKRYREWAHQQGLLEGEMPALEELHARLAASFHEKTPPVWFGDSTRISGLPAISTTLVIPPNKYKCLHR